MRKLLALLATPLLLTLGSVQAGAITGGTEDTGNRYPFVGMLAFYDDQGDYLHRCTGTLMSSTVVLTAGHCTDGTGSARAYFAVDVTDDYPNAVGAVPGTPHTHPDYDARTLANDVAVVVLAEGQGAGPYPTLPAEGRLSDMKRAHEIQDDMFLAVGYGGVTGFPPPVITFDDRIRRYSESPYGGLTRNNLHLQQNPNVAPGGTCFGDSGGPHFWEDKLMLVSVTSWGDAICRSNDMTQRVDLPGVLEFLEGYGLFPPA